MDKYCITLRYDYVSISVELIGSIGMFGACLLTYCAPDSSGCPWFVNSINAPFLRHFVVWSVKKDNTEVNLGEESDRINKCVIS